MKKLREILQDIISVKDIELTSRINSRLDDLTKPQGSLGRLEKFVTQFCLCRGCADATIKKSAIYTFAGDHGITKQGVAPYPSEVTKHMVLNMLSGGAAISVMCRNAGIDFFVVDAGVNGDFDDHPKLIKKKVGRGTRDFSQEPAMSEGSCCEAMVAGYEIAAESKVDLIGIGEMGIGNSSSASAIYSLLLDLADPSIAVGAGTGAANSLLAHKKAVIAKAVMDHRKTWDHSAFDALRRVGGFEIAAMTGMILGAATRRIPVAVDGFISSAAALVAMKMNEHVSDYLFFAHESAEQFHAGFLEKVGIRPILQLGMRLGEGTGAVLAMQIISQAMNCYHQMATFGQAQVANKK